MQLFHGTDSTAASAIAGPPQAVNISKGGGELGQGFYAGDSLSLAVAWANGHHGMGRAKILEIDIDNSSYAGLNIEDQRGQSNLI